MTARLLALGLLACVPAAFATSVAVSARAYGCDHPGTSSASCVGPDGSSSSASAGFFPFGIHAILDAQGPSSINGLSEGSASALAFLDLLSVLGGRTGTAWVFPSVQRSVDSFTTSNT